MSHQDIVTATHTRETPDAQEMLDLDPVHRQH